MRYTARHALSRGKELLGRIIDAQGGSFNHLVTVQIEGHLKMKQITLPFLAFLMLALVGCGGSSMELPKSAITEDCFAVQWYDTAALTPDMAKDMISGIADDMSDDQPKARLWMSASADTIEAGYEKKWDAFTEAGGLGFLRLHYMLEKKGEDDADPTTHYRTYVLIRVKKKTDIGDLEEAIADFVKDDNMGGKVKLEKVKGEEEWYWLTTEERPDGFDLPEDEDEESVKVFKKLIGQAGGAPAITVWRTHERLTEAFKKELDDDDNKPSDDRKERLEEAINTESIVMYVTPGKSPKVVVKVTFTDKEYAKTFAEEHNSNLAMTRRGMKIALMSTESPPHPSVVDRLVDQLEVKASGSSVSITMSSRSVEDGMAIQASLQGARGVDTTSPNGIFTTIERGLQVPSMAGVMDVFSVNFRDPSGRSQ